MSCLAAALPLAIENPAATLPLASENPPAVKTDEVASLGPEAREEPSTSQVSLLFFCRTVCISLSLLFNSNKPF